MLNGALDEAEKEKINVGEFLLNMFQNALHEKIKRKHVEN